MSDRVLVYCDSKGRQMLAMPDGTTVPKVAMTRVAQDSEQAGGGYCKVFALINARIATPEQAKEIEDAYIAKEQARALAIRKKAV